MCAEAYHAFCCPPPCPAVNEETRLNWQCPRCRTCANPKCGAAIDAEAETPEARSRPISPLAEARPHARRAVTTRVAAVRYLAPSPRAGDDALRGVRQLAQVGSQGVVGAHVMR